MPNRLKKLLHSPFPFYFNYWRHNLVMVIAIAAFVAFFLGYFQPGTLMSDDLSEIPAQVIGYSLITLVIGGIMILIVPSIKTRTFELERWTFGKYIAYNFLVVIVVSIVNGIFNLFYLEENFTLIQWATFDFRNTFVIALLILVPASYMIRTWVLSQNLLLAQETNRRLMAKHSATPAPAEKPAALLLETDTKEKFEVPAKTMLFAESQDNYVQVYWNKDGQLRNRMLRISQGRLLYQLNDKLVIRCHRSFVVNLNRVTAVNGNSNGLTLILDNGLAEVPVSRSHVEAVQQLLDGNENS